MGVGLRATECTSTMTMRFMLDFFFFWMPTRVTLEQAEENFDAEENPFSPDP